MKDVLKNGRIRKEIKTRELAKLVGIDQALISKFENGSRIPTRIQILKLAEVLEIDKEALLTSWIKIKITNDFGKEPLFLKAILELLNESGYKNTISNEPKIDSILEEMEILKNKLQQLR
jgi:transcriptional regulator with XRE-family HTH domain